MRKMIPLFLFLCLAAFAAGAAWADILVMKDGKRIHVDEFWENGDNYECVRFGGVVIYPKAQVREVIREDASAQPAPAPAPAPAAASRAPAPAPALPSAAAAPVPRGGLALGYFTSTRVMKKALADGADPNQVDEDGNTAAHLYATRPSFVTSATLLSLLVDAGANLGIQNKKGETPLMVAFNSIAQGGEDADPAGTRPEAPPLDQCRRIVDILLKNTPDVNTADQDGSTPLIAVCRMKAGNNNSYHYMVAEELVVKGADPGVSNYRERTALHNAVENCSVDIIRLLMNQGADPKATDRWGQTPFALAKKCGADADVITRILERQIR